MSWMQNRQQHQGQPNPAVQISSPTFSSPQQEQWAQDFPNQLASQSQSQATWHSLQKEPLQAARDTNQSWQQKNLQQNSQTAPYSPKSQQQSAESWIQSNQQPQKHFATHSTYQQNSSNQSPSLQANAPLGLHQNQNSEQMAALEQGSEIFETQTTTDGWGDWDWGENNNQTQTRTEFVSAPTNHNIIEESFKSEPNDNWQYNISGKQYISLPGQTLTENPDVDQVDSQKETSPGMGALLPPASMIEGQQYKTTQTASSKSSLPYNQSQVSVQPVRPHNLQQTVHSVPVSQYYPRNQQKFAQDSSGEIIPSLASTNAYTQKNKYLESITSSTATTGNMVSSGQQLKSGENPQPVGSPVYVSQAKPVSQPPRQYAVSPSVSGESTPIQSSSNHSYGQNNNSNLQGNGLASQSTLPRSSQSPGIPFGLPTSKELPLLASSNLYSAPPPPPFAQNTMAASSNPYKRVGAAQHGIGLNHVSKNSQQSSISAALYAAPMQEFQSSQNQESFAPDNSEIVDKNIEVENLEVAPSNDRNRYLQTSHLSEEGYNSTVHISGISQDQSNEVDNFPPPGLSRLVLGQPEIGVQQNFSNQPEIPPGLDRMIPGTELATSNLNLERQADGQDTIPSPRSAFTNVPPVEENASENIDITADRNLYLVPGESDIQVQRVVTGLENGSANQENKQREIELDGENLEDRPQMQHQNYPHDEITRDEPIEGANTLDEVVNQNLNHETESSLTLDTNVKDLSNVSTGNDDSDHRERQSIHLNKARRSEERKRRPESNIDKREDRYDSEESDISSDQERRRYREGSVRNDRNRGSKERERIDKRDHKDRGRYRDDKDEDDRRNRKYERDRERGRYERSRYETDSRYETEGSTRFDRRRNDRDRARDRYENDYRRDEKDRRYRRERRDDRDERRRTDREYRDDRDRRRDRDHREKNRSEYDEEYRKNRSDREKDRGREKDPRYQMYGYPHGYNYDLYYQQHQKYYEQLRRSNPQAYSEWYHKYYAHMQGDLMANDGRESVHSGRSSTNNEKEKQANLSLGILDGSTITQDPQRSTPCKFTTEHSTASLSTGLLVSVKPKYSSNGVTNIVKILKLGPNDCTKRLFQSFPGPLIHGQSHKKTIIEFCEEQIRQGPPSMALRSRQNSYNSVCSIGQTHKSSFTLMWNLLILLLRQNGLVVGTDIAELLMKNKSQFPYDIQPASSTVNVRSNSEQSLNDVGQSKNIRHSEGESDDQSRDNPNDQDSDEMESKKTLTELEITERFRNYLLYGNVNEALEWATDHNLWGHALFLASKVDRRSHANVMMKFANKLALNDPLQTLYQLMSGRPPSSVTSIQDERWGDWRPHLAMILSNTSQKPELNRKAITTLGDSLYNRGDLFGAQFCYLMAQVEFGRYANVNQDSNLMPNSPNAIRLVLLGSSQHKSFREFATNEAIMMTEIYEYACSLNDDKFSIAEFQPFKWLMATRMLDYGFQLKTLMYMEQISLHINRDPTKYETVFIDKVYKLAERLKFYDPVLEKTMDDQSMEPNQGSFEGQKWLHDLRNVLDEIKTKSKNSPYLCDNEQLPKPINQQFTQINQQLSELTQQYNNFDPMQSTNAYQVPSESQFEQNEQEQMIQQHNLNNQQQQSESYPQYYGSNQTHNPMLVPSMNHDRNVGYGSGTPQSEYLQPSYDQQSQQSTVRVQKEVAQGYDYWNQQQQQNEIQRPTISMPNSVSNRPGFYDDGSKHDNLKLSTPIQTNGTSTDQKKPNSTKNESRDQIGSMNTNSGWFGGIWNKLSLKPKNQMILPDDKNPTIVWDSEKKKWVNKEGDEHEQESFKPPPKMGEILPSAQSPIPYQISQNQLPNTQLQSHPIVQHQQAVLNGQANSKHATEASDASPNPLSVSAANGSSTPIMESSKTPNLQSNMFKMQRNRTLKNSYVDVFNPSGAQSTKPAEPVLAPVVPTVALPQGGFFIPAMDAIDDSKQKGTSEFYNPNQYGGYQ